MRNLSVTALVALMLAGHASAQDVSWRATSPYPPNSNSGAAFEALRDVLAEETDGAFTLALNPGSSLGFGNGDNFDIVRDGVVEVAETLSGALIGTDPRFGVISLPFIASDDAATDAMMEKVMSSFEAIFEENDQVLIGWGAFPAVGVFADRELTDPDMFAGVKLRTFDAFSADAVATLGGSPVQLPFGEVVSALSSGLVDGVLTSTEGGRSISALDLGITDFSDLRYSTPITLLHVSRSAWDDLSPKYRAALEKAGAEYTRVHVGQGRDSVAGNLKILQENGVSVHTAVSERMLELASEIRDTAAIEWAEENGEEASQLLESILRND